MAGFNPRARGGRDASTQNIGLPCLFQSTRPRGARLSTTALCNGCSVSIHAPAGGATSRLFRKLIKGCFNPRARGGRDPSIEAGGGQLGFNPRARGGRDKQCSINAQSPMFQSTRPRGARHNGIYTAQVFAVSIHAPAGGATYWHGWLFLFQSFNPRARGGRDIPWLPALQAEKFQSTRPRGARPFV